jgi:RNA polymerase sigma-70 factor (ECF subfamily)
MVVVRFKPPRTAVTRQGFDAAYLQRLCGGDPQTEAHFSAYFGELILIKARARRLSNEVAQDVRQETFLRVLRTLRSPDGLRTPEALGAFVHGVCSNVLRERYRDEKRHRPPGENPAPLPDTSTPNAEARLIDVEKQQAVRRVLEAMTPHNRKLLSAVWLDERDREEVCRECNVSPDYLRVLLHRAKNEFRALYVERETLPPRAAVNGGTTRQPAGDRPLPSSTGGDRRRRTVGL